MQVNLHAILEFQSIKQSLSIAHNHWEFTHRLLFLFWAFKQSKSCLHCSVLKDRPPIPGQGILLVVVSITLLYLVVQKSPHSWHQLCGVCRAGIGRQSSHLWHPNKPRKGRLGKNVPDLLVYVAQEVHVGGAAIGAFVLHKEVVEPWLQLVPLTHNCQLRKKKPNQHEEQKAHQKRLSRCFCCKTAVSKW